MRRSIAWVSLLLVAIASNWASAQEDNEQQAGRQPSAKSSLPWLTNYGQAMKAASRQEKMLFLFFHDSKSESELVRFEETVFADQDLKRSLDSYVLAKLPTSTRIKIKGKEIALLDHSAFREMHGRAGVAIIDQSDPQSGYYGHVVSVYPFKQRRLLNRLRLTELLRLPRGSLTQRTLIFAVRTHAEKPRSTNGKFHPVLAEATESHSLHQARIQHQGHHNWETRFHRLNAKMPSGMTAREVCAESWPGEDLVDAAIECVHSWRQSSGHWAAVSSAHNYFGYDMKRGSNGIWYATGIFSSK